MRVAHRGVTVKPANPLDAIVVMYGDISFCWFLSTGRVLSPTQFVRPFWDQAMITSPLWRPVIAGGIRPLPLNFDAEAMPTAVIQSLLKEISLEASLFVALLS